MSILFKELVNVEAIESNPLKEIEKKSVEKKIRKVLTREERIKIDKFLREEGYTFWRYTQIFFHSGARESELMRIRKEDVFLNEQYYIATINIIV